MAEETLIYWGIRTFCLHSLLPVALSRSYSLSWLRESVKSFVEALGVFCMKDVLLFQIEEFQENTLILLKEMKIQPFGELCLLYAKLHAKADDQTKIHVFLCHRVAILKLEIVWQKVSPERKM